MEKITYASLASLGEDFHDSFDSALTRVRSVCGKTHPFYINGSAHISQNTFDDVSPANTEALLGTFQRGTLPQAHEAIFSAKKAFPFWRNLDWAQRIDLLRRAAGLMSERQFEFAAILTLEVGKNRFEAIAEVSEAVDLILYYAQQIESHHGYEIPLVESGREQTKTVLKPYGVWAVVSPFNFPLALATGMAAGALLAGNTVVFKPASDTPWSGLCLYEIFRDAGLPNGVFNFITGDGQTLGHELLHHHDVDGFVFTGSREIGTKMLSELSPGFPKPRIAEMGGKNPAIIMPTANLDDATEGVMRSAFGMGGQKCSACSRLYLHEKIYDHFLDLLIQKTANLKIGDPTQRETFLGPLINEHALKTYQDSVKHGKKQGRLLYGGHRLIDGEMTHGFFVTPAIFDQLLPDSPLFRDELFVPLLAVAKIRSLDEALQMANHVDYGLTAGIFTNEADEEQKFFNEIEAGVTYCNRRGGATTGAWPGVQSFGGWKASGSSGKSALGPYYVAQFMREQSQTAVPS